MKQKHNEVIELVEEVPEVEVYAVDDPQIVNVDNSNLWDKLGSGFNRKPVLKFQVNEPHTVKFLCERPREYPRKDKEGEFFFVFDVQTKEGDKLKDYVIITSAFTLMKGIKLQEPILNKELIICKKMKQGKQIYEVGLAN